jgi:hypothetical protein
MTTRTKLVGVALAVASGLGALIATRGGPPGAASVADAATPQAQEAGRTVPMAPDSASLPPGVKPRHPTGMTAAEAIAAHDSATRGPLQPIPFNHRFHTEELLMQCDYCHGRTGLSPVAVVPPVELCMGCHRIVGAQLEPIQRLRGYWERKEPIPWVRIHKLPDFVQFPHEAHIRSQVDCEECHGKVQDMDRVYQVNSLKMGWCLNCHMGKGETTDVATDRLLVEKFPPPEIPGGRQAVGLYPRRIDEQYAAHRAPIDCTACHH